MKYFLAVFILFFAFTPSWAQKQDQLLLKAYQSGSTEKLELFFNKWIQETPPLSPVAMEVLNDTVRNVYLLFQQFYNPLKIESIGGSEWGNDIYKKTKYFLLQDNISFGFVDTLDKDILLKKQYAWLAKQLNITVDSAIRGAKTCG